MFSVLTLLTALGLIAPEVFSGPIPTPISLVARQLNTSDIYADWPSYADLPLHPSFPTKAAWGVWGEDDELGALNHITHSTILAAKSEIQKGIAINLNLELTLPNPPVVTLHRPPLVHAFIAAPGYQDDIISLNTQISTQFDGLRHYPYSTNNAIDTYQFYNDLISFDDIFSSNDILTLGIHNAAQKGIAGRGILLDWAALMDSKNETFDAFSARAITVDDLNEVISWQGINTSSFHPGDFLVIRTGWTKQYRSLSPLEQSRLPFRAEEDNQWVGIDASQEMLEWIWDKKISIIGSDNPGVEVLPFSNAASRDETPRNLHQIFISGWGQSIVELLDLDSLAEACHSLNRYSFFFTIQNLNVPGGIASPPNALALL